VTGTCPAVHSLGILYYGSHIQDCTCGGDLHGRLHCRPRLIEAGNGAISPAAVQSVEPGGTVTFTISPLTGKSDRISGRQLWRNLECNIAGCSSCNIHHKCGQPELYCPGLLCPRMYTVTPTYTEPDPMGTISPTAAAVVTQNAIVTISISPEPGYHASVAGTCGGLLNTSVNPFVVHHRPDCRGLRSGSDLPPLPSSPCPI